MRTIDRIAEPRAEGRKQRPRWGAASPAWDDRLWKEDLFWEFVSEDELNESECFEEFMEKVYSSGLDFVMDKDSVDSIAIEVWDEYWSKYY